jgi:hypothetical protein
MVTHMKTTIDIADSLFAEAKATAAEQGTTLRSLIEEGLRLSLARRRQGGAFRLRDASFTGDGVRTEVSLEHWDEIRGLVYGGHGG